MKKSFTLIELLVVVAIIALLISILLPSLNLAREHAKTVKCQTNMISLTKAFLMFSNNNNGFLTGNADSSDQSEYWKSDWLSGQGPIKDYSISYPQTPESGTLFPYYGKQPLILRCPSLKVGELGSGVGSNGKFDYAMTEMFGGALLSRIENMSRFKNPDDSYQSMPTPLVVEEEPSYYINSSAIEGSHGNYDKLSHIHRGGSSYIAIDGSVHFFSEPLDCNALSWELLTPSGQWISNRTGSFWGEWNNL